MEKIHLVCNAHIDPVWLWEWEEGAAAAISTFRVAADFCEAYDGFVFNHNEVTLYRWVEEYEPELFKRIQNLVKQGKWHIMGGWYLQPDCNMPSGESFVRQILLGRQYFKEKFGVEPTTAINFDPFGHSRGLVQIIKKSGYDSYVFCRPGKEDCHLPGETFVWVGLDGSEIIGQRVLSHYNSVLGKADEKVMDWMKEHPNEKIGMILWGVGNHGGGPSRIDIQKLDKLIEDTENIEIVHSIPEDYFKEIKEANIALPRHEKDINAWAVGCYTSQIRIKQKHRLLENEFYKVEKMMSHVALTTEETYPRETIREALYDLMEGEFHDILPGSAIQPVEETSIRLMDHGLEILSRLKAKAFFRLSAGQAKAKKGEIPILIYNPHPYKIKGIFECEFSLADQNWEQTFSVPTVYQEGKEIPSQIEKEASNLTLDWRKKVAFYAELEASTMNRFDCQIEVLPQKPQAVVNKVENKIVFKTQELEVHINCHTGLIDKYEVNGKDYLLAEAFKPLVIADNEDVWGMNVNAFRTVKGAFTLLDKEEGSKFSGIRGSVLDSVRIVEDGAVRTVVEAVFRYEESFICQTYKLPKQGTELEVQVRVQWAQKDTMLKLAIPTVERESEYIGQVPFGKENLLTNGREVVAQKWVAVINKEQDMALTCINDGVYGSDFEEGEFRISLLRSPAYSGYPIEEREIVPQDRFSPRVDQGERQFTFWINAGSLEERMQMIDKEAHIHNEKPFALSFFPSGQGEKVKPLIELSNESIQMSAFKQSEKDEDYIVRLFETTGNDAIARVDIPSVEISQEVKFSRFEVKTMKVSLKDRRLYEVNLMEEKEKNL